MRNVPSPLPILTVQRKDRVPPPAQRVERVEQLPVRREHALRLERRGLAQKRVLVGETMVELGLAGAALLHDVVEARLAGPCAHTRSAAAETIRSRMAAPRAVSRRVFALPGFMTVSIP